MQEHRRSSVLNIENWLDKCSNDEPDSMIYDPDYCSGTAAIKTQQKAPELEALYKTVTDTSTKIGLPPNLIEERLVDIDECITAYLNAIQKDVQDEYDKLCLYKLDLLNQIQKMLKDLYLPPYEPDENITLLQHCKRMKTKYNELNIVKEKRMTRWQELREKQTKYCLVLGIKAPLPRTQTDIPTEEELTKFGTAVQELEREERRRRDKYTLLKDMITRCMDQLEYIPQNDFEKNILTDVPEYTDSHLLKMSNLHSKLEAHYTIVQEKYEKLKSRLISLYDRLDVCQQERDLFLNSHSICKPSLMSEMEVEIEQFEELKRKNIGKFIDKIKEELVREYERCYVHKDDQEKLLALSDYGECNEKLLELYEKELERWKKHYEDNKDMLEKFQKWEMMWKELIQLEEKAYDPNRFNNRGGQLLLEERKRKALQKNLPKVEKELIALNEQYSENHQGQKFMVFSTNLDEFIAGCWDELNNVKEVEKRQRQLAKMKKPLQPQTHTHQQTLRTPTKRLAGAGITPTPTKLQSHLSALSVSEKEFEEMVKTRPTSAKRTRY